MSKPRGIAMVFGALAFGLVGRAAHAQPPTTAGSTGTAAEPSAKDETDEPPAMSASDATPSAVPPGSDSWSSVIHKGAGEPTRLDDSPETSTQQTGHHGAAQVTLGAQLQYGVWTGKGEVNAFGPGVGVRGGVTLGPGVYVGANFDYFGGQSVEGAPLHVNVYDFLGEVGYDFRVYPEGVLRPKVGFGLGAAHVSGCEGLLISCDGLSRNGVAVAPGVQYLHFFAGVYLSLEGRFQLISVEGWDPSGIVFGAGLGFAP